MALLHSISSSELACAVSKRCCAHGIVQPVLLEVNVSGEQSKSGFSPAEAREAVEALAALPGIRLEGIMTCLLYTSVPRQRRFLDRAREDRSCRRAVHQRRSAPEGPLGGRSVDHGRPRDGRSPGGLRSYR